MSANDRGGALAGAAAAASTAALAVLAMWSWFNVSDPGPMRKRVPGMDGAGSSTGRPGGEAAVDIKGFFRKFDGSPSAIAASWPRFRGEASDNIAPGGTTLASSWAGGQPALLWSVQLGDGYAGPAVRNGRVYVLDYDEAEQSDCLRCFSFDNGAEIWRRWYKARVKRNHGMSRTVPAVTDRHVVTIGPRCHVLCVDAVTGDFRWGIDLVADHGAKVPMWYTGQCPLIDGETAVLAPCGRALLMGVDCETGRVLWETPNADGWEMSHASVMPMTLGGRALYVYCAVGGMALIAADGPDKGRLLARTAEWNHPVVAPSAVPLDDGRILVTAGYGAGSMMFRVVELNGSYSIEPLYRLDRSVFACEQHTPVFHRGRLFTVLPSDAGAARRELACMAPGGSVLWTSGKENRFGLGPFMIADGKILVLDNDGVLTMAQADADTYVQLAQAKVLEGPESWAPLALVEGRLLARDLRRMVCLDLRAQLETANAGR